MRNLLILFSLGIFGLAGCESANDSQLGKAQTCLDHAQSAADAANCSNILGGVTGIRASRIRCGIAVLEAGLTQDKIVSSFGAIGNTAQDPIIEIGTGLAIGDTAGDVTTAQNIQSICDQAESNGLELIANLIVFSTQAATAASGVCGAPPNPPTGAYNTCLAANISSMSNTDAGNFAISTYQIYCTPTFSNTQICTSLQNAGANGTDPNAVGAALKACLSTNTCR